MTQINLFKDKVFAVLGLGRSGKSVVRSMLKAGAKVFAWDDQEAARQKAMQENITLVDLANIDWSQVDYFVLSPGIPHRYPAPHPYVAFAKAHGLNPMSDIEVLYLSQPDSRFIGITGTNGKSTTTALIGHLLKAAGYENEIGGNIGIPALDLKRFRSDEFYVLELSSYQLELSPSAHFQIGVLLNISPDHLERHGGLDGYIEAKKLITANLRPEDTLIIGVDDPYCQTLYSELRQTAHYKIIPISAYKSVSEGVFILDGNLVSEIRQIPEKKVIAVKSLENLKGNHNWQNAAAAVAVAMTLEIPLSLIQASLKSFPGLAHRQQKVSSYKNIQFINDSKATNADAAAKALACYQDQSIYWLLGGRAKEGGIESLKSYFANIKHAYTYGEAAVSFSATLEGQVPFSICESLQEALAKAFPQALADEKEAVILLSPACASFDQFQDFEKRGEAFCTAVDEMIKSFSSENESKA